MFSFTPDADGQSFEGISLNLQKLDQRVFEWKTALNLFNQEHFPPKNFQVSEAGVKFHDRSHILLQDFLGMTSEGFRLIYQESSMPSVYEEILTYFCAQLVNKPTEEPSTFTVLDKVKEDIQFMQYIGYVDENSFFIQQKEVVAQKIQEVFIAMSSSENFQSFRQTLIQASLDCQGWNVIG